MKQNNSLRTGCSYIHHNNHEIIKICLNKECKTERRLCYKCQEEKIHEKDINFNPAEIVEMVDFGAKLNQYTSQLKELITQMVQIENNLKSVVEQIEKQIISQLQVIRSKCNSYIEDNYKILEHVNLRQIDKDSIDKSLVIETDLQDMKVQLENIDQLYKDSFVVIQSYLDPSTLPSEYQKFFQFQRRMVSHKNIQNQFDPNIVYQETSLKGHTHQIKAMKLYNQNNKNLLITGGQDKQLIIWDTKIGQKIKWISTENEIASICMSPDYKIYVGDTKGFLNIFDLKRDDLQFLQSHKLHSQMITMVQMKSKDQIITFGEDIKITSLNNLSLIRKLTVKQQEWTNFDYSPKGNILAVVDGSGISIFDAENGNKIINEPNVYLDDEKIMIQLDQNGQRLITAEYDTKSIKLYKIELQEAKLVLINKIQTDFDIVNISWCLNDSKIIYQQKYEIVIMSVENYQIIKKIELKPYVDITSFMFTKQDNNLNYILSKTTAQDVLLYKPQI